MKTKVQMWGNSLALRIPKSFAVETDLQAESEVELSLIEGTLVVTPVTQPSYLLEDLLEGITETNLHNEVSTGAPLGKELW